MRRTVRAPEGGLRPGRSGVSSSVAITPPPARRAHSPCAQISNAGSLVAQPRRTSRPWILHPRHRPRTDSIHISVRQMAQMVRGSMPRMPLLVMIIIEKAIPRPSVHANRLGFAETQFGAWRSVMARAITPIGL